MLEMCGGALWRPASHLGGLIEPMAVSVAQQTKWTVRRRHRFLSLLRQTGNVSAAAEHCGVSRSGAYALRAADTEFRAAWDDAIESALDDLEAELRRRAIEGTEKPVFYGGETVGTIRSYSDSLAMFLLRSRRPHVFGERGEGLTDGPRGTETAAEVRRRLEEKLAGLGRPARNDEAEGE